jgi:hypothetical protein
VSSTRTLFTAYHPSVSDGVFTDVIEHVVRDETARRFADQLTRSTRAYAACFIFTFRMIDCEILCSGQVSVGFFQREVLDAHNVKE